MGTRRCLEFLTDMAEIAEHDNARVPSRLNARSEPGVSSSGPIERHKTVGVGILGVGLVMLAARLDPFR
jgi:hypothetical protein